MNGRIIKLLLLFLHLSAVIGWPDANKYEDCNKDTIMYLVKRACAQPKRSAQYKELRAIGRGRYEETEDEALRMPFMKEIRVGDEEEPTTEAPAAGAAISSWRRLWTNAYRRNRQGSFHSVVLACCSIEGCKDQQNVPGLKDLCFTN